jgi:hypothetical protein
MITRVRTRDGQGAVAAMAVLVLALAAATGVVVWFGASAAERAETGVLAPVAFASVIATPAVLALMGGAERPWLLVCAGLALLPMVPLSFSFMFAPLLVPAGVFFGVAVARPRLPVHGRAQPIAAALSLVFVVAAIANLVGGGEERTVTTATASWSGQIMTARASLTTIAFVVAAVAIGALAPRDRRRAEV